MSAALVICVVKTVTAGTGRKRAFRNVGPLSAVTQYLFACLIIRVRRSYRPAQIAGDFFGAPFFCFEPSRVRIPCEPGRLPFRVAATVALDQFDGPLPARLAFEIGEQLRVE